MFSSKWACVPSGLRVLATVPGFCAEMLLLLLLLSLLQCGYLADKHNRVLLLAAIIIIGEAPCLCTYWVSCRR
jgi:hypothetical protein